MQQEHHQEVGLPQDEAIEPIGFLNQTQPNVNPPAIRKRKINPLRE